MHFYVGLHQPSDARHFERCMVSVSRLRDRKSDFQVGEWMMDSGAFMELKLFGGYRDDVATYAAHIRRWARCGRLVAAVGQDYMCEQFMLDRTGMDVATHQRLTIERYDALIEEDTGVYILPVLQGYKPEEYVSHIAQYGKRLHPPTWDEETQRWIGPWVGVGSVCKRNANVADIEEVLIAITDARPDLRLHGFGVKTIALESSIVRSCLHSADSMAWSFAARKARHAGDMTRDANNWEEARDFTTTIKTQRVKQRAYQRRFL
jgi:hypothetical protein